MSVDYYTCNYCGETFPDCGYYTTCEGCGTQWCCDECAEADGFIREHCNKYIELTNRDRMEEYREEHCEYNDCSHCKHYVGESCKYCRHEDYDDYTLLNAALELLKINREELISIVNQYKEDSE